MTVVNKADFICSFKQIQNFPFHTLVCIFQIFVSGTANVLTRLRMVEDIRDAGPSTVDQYVVQGRYIKAYIIDNFSLHGSHP